MSFLVGAQKNVFDSAFATAVRGKHQQRSLPSGRWKKSPTVGPKDPRPVQGGTLIAEVTPTKGNGKGSDDDVGDVATGANRTDARLCHFDFSC